MLRLAIGGVKRTVTTQYCDCMYVRVLYFRYTKRGLLEGPCGDRLDKPQETPALEPSNAISILISSDFLKMDTLV